MFRSIIDNDIRSLKALCAKIVHPSAVLFRCLNHLSLQPQEVKSLTVLQMHSHLTELQLFAAKYRDLSRTDRLEASVLAQRLFGFSLDESGLEATIFLTSFMADQTETSPSLIRINEQHQPVVDAKALGTWMKTCVEDHVISILHKHAIACLDAGSFAPLCPRYLDGQTDCTCTRLHVQKDRIANFYNDQLCLYLKQIEVLSYAEPRDYLERRDQRKYVYLSFTISYLIVLSVNTFAASSLSFSHPTNPRGTLPALRDGIQVLYMALRCCEPGFRKVH
jgi:hypothetical protein